ncbi:Utp14 domain containing protein [Elaphomyces granulatus]
MPGRHANLRGPKDKPFQQKKKQKISRGLDALAIAESQYPQKPKFRRHRLGDIDEGPKRKRAAVDNRRDPEGSNAKRPRTHNDLSDASVNGGSDSEGNAWELGKVPVDDDSELDSDEAMGSSDEEKFEGFIFRGSSSTESKPKPKPKPQHGSASTGGAITNYDYTIGLSEDECVGDLGEEAVDLATAWDMNSNSDDFSDKPKKSNDNKPEIASEASESGDASDDSFSDDSCLSVSDEEGATTERGLSELQSFVNAMDPGTVHKRALKSRNGQEQQAPTEYGLVSTRKLTVADLLPSITNPLLKSSLKLLDPGISSQKSKSTGLARKLAAPLPKRQQDRLDRVAAYEKSKETLDRWIETVKANRRAEHLFFPHPELKSQQSQRLGPVKSQTELENTIQEILVENGLVDSNEKDAEELIEATEELETRKLALGEMRARIAELRKRRDLLFREELRAKRIKKIKSKSYRRVHRKERERMAQAERQALMEAGVNLDEEERERNDRRRAEARMNAKHRESKWAKSLKQTGRTVWDEEARISAADMTRREEELRRRIEGKQVTASDYLGSSSSDLDDHEDQWPQEDYSDAEAQILLNKLSELDGGGDGPIDVTSQHSKLLSMKFMKNAEAAQKLQNDTEINTLRQKLEGGNLPSDSEVETGRRKFGHSQDENFRKQRPSHPKNEFEEELGSDEETSKHLDSEHDDRAGANRHGSQKGNISSPTVLSHQRRGKKVESSPVENPWLTQSCGKDHGGAKSPDDTLDILLEHSVSIAPHKSGSRMGVDERQAPKIQLEVHQAPDANIHDESSSDDAQTPVLLRNHDLVKMAFAGDEVVADFEKEKLEAVEEEGDKIIDNTLPGWGSWTGKGISKKQQKRQKRFFTSVEGVKPENRKDAKLARVIINEKRIRKNTKYLASQLPHPFESKQQYERSLRVPIGPEWTTKETFQNSTKPRLIVKQGVIKPLTKPLI